MQNLTTKRRVSPVFGLIVVVAMGIPEQSRATVVDVSATDADGVTLGNLARGTYLVTPIAGTFKAWNPWNSVTGCQQGADCTTGWINSYRVIPDGQASIAVTKNGIWSGPDAALAHAHRATFDLLLPGNVTFILDDTVRTDNLGGMSFDLKPIPGVPEPGSIITFLVGLMAIGYQLTRDRRGFGAQRRELESVPRPK